MEQEKNFLQNIKASATKIIDDIGESFRDFSDFIISIKDLATKRDNKKAKEFFAIVAHLGAMLTKAGVSKPQQVSVLDLGEMMSPALGQEKAKEITR